jgi:hypothetical protein
VIDDDSDEFGDVERIINVPSAGSVNRGHDQISQIKERLSSVESAVLAL